VVFGSSSSRSYSLETWSGSRSPSHLSRVNDFLAPQLVRSSLAHPSEPQEEIWARDFIKGFEHPWGRPPAAPMGNAREENGGLQVDGGAISCKPKVGAVGRILQLRMDLDLVSEPVEQLMKVKLPPRGV